jgi:adenylosuccinate synthase
MTKGEEMTATKIYEAIKARHSGPGWTLIAEAPTTTGHDRRAGWIDAYAIGMWSSNRITSTEE